MTDIDKIARAHELDENSAAINCDLHTRRILDRESAFIAKVRELEKAAAKFHEDYRTQLNEIVRCHDKITQLEKDKAGLVEAEKRYAAAFVRIAQAHGITSPMQLIGKAVDDNENYAEILARVVESKMDSIKQHGGEHE